jgi:hypothetical protein
MASKRRAIAVEGISETKFGGGDIVGLLKHTIAVIDAETLVADADHHSASRNRSAAAAEQRQAQEAEEPEVRQN